MTLTESSDKPGVPPKQEEGDDPIAEAVSKRICTHMNDDHAVTVYGMAQKVLFLVSTHAIGDGEWKLTSAKLHKVTSEGCDIKVTKCKRDGDMCEMQTVHYPFSRRLSSADEVKKELVEIHNRVLAPSFLWLTFKPRCIIINALMTGLFIGTLIFRMGGYVAGLFWFLVVGHIVEGAVAAWRCRNVLKLGWKTTRLWYLCVLPVGMPIMQELKSLCMIVHESKKAKSNKKSD